ncbi:MAG: DegT/DnrJ/EryC1/StrS family aminotransferase [Rhodospirillaceae bacterium]|nr:DegT/DnrJ/EryC1/StrS family aminotransferase [Rhodospirillaceae bacterium]
MANYTIPFTDIVGRYSRFRSLFHHALDDVLDHGQFILGKDVELFESRVAKLVGSAHAIGVGNGTDALVLSLKAAGVGPGDEVVTSPMSYLASASAIHLAGGTPVFADVGDDLNLSPIAVREVLSTKTKAILVVHLAGIPAPMEELVEIAKDNGLHLIEDCAQAFGATINGKCVGGFGEFGAVSFHPLKNIGALGDAGLVLTNNANAASWLKQARNHGHKGRDDCSFWSQNTRLDTLQAAFLDIVLDAYSEDIAGRREQVKLYRSLLSQSVNYPLVSTFIEPTYNFFMILVDRRDELIRFLESKGIEAKVHYPTLIHKMSASLPTKPLAGDLRNAEKMTARILSLPLGQHLSGSKIEFICRSIIAFQNADK